MVCEALIASLTLHYEGKLLRVSHCLTTRMCRTMYNNRQRISQSQNEYFDYSFARKKTSLRTTFGGSNDFCVTSNIACEVEPQI